MHSYYSYFHLCRTPEMTCGILWEFVQL